MFMQIKERYDFSQLLTKVLRGPTGKEIYDGLRSMNDMNVLYRVIPAGDFIAYEDTVLQQVLFVFRGEFASWKSSASGKKHMEMCLPAPQFIGIDRALNVKYKNSSDCIATQNCEILIMNQGYFVGILQQNGELAVEVLRNILSKMSMSMVKSGWKSMYDATDRMLVYLHSYISGSRREKAVYRITRTKKELAASIGVSDRTIYRVLRQLKEEGYLSGVEGCIIVDQAQLQKIKTKVVLLLID